MLGIQAKEFNLGFIRPVNIVSQGLRVLRCLLANSKHMPLTEEWLPSGHSTIKVWLVECCRDGYPSGRFSHLHRGTLEFCQSDYWVLGHLPDKGPSLQIAQFGWVSSSRKSLGGSKLLLFKNDGGHCVLRDLQCYIYFWVPFSRSVPRHNLVSELYGQFLRPHGLVLLWHALSTVI